MINLVRVLHTHFVQFYHLTFFASRWTTLIRSCVFNKDERVLFENLHSRKFSPHTP
jgi:hypothetical protein